MKNKEFSATVSAICLILFLLIAAVASLTAQTIEHKPGKKGPLIVWNNGKAFKDQPKLKPLDWSTYGNTWDGKQFAAWGAMAVAGVLWGAREAYHADPYIFERRWGVGSESFWGSDAWKRNYVGNNPDNQHKHEYLGNFGRDVWHTFGFSSNALTVSGVWVISTRKQPMKYRAVNMLLGIGARSVAASLTYNALRA